jgi:predicted branched-subunit amino acid permease
MRPIVRDGLGVGVAVGALGLSFGALAVASGLSVLQACALSLLMFTGASQFAFVGLIGGGVAAAVATALLLGARNSLYGLRLAPYLRPRGLAAHFVIDESAAMAVRDTPDDTRLGFWSAGLAVFAFWNVATLIGALAGNAISDPNAFGLDAAAPAAFLALLAPRLTTREPQAIAGLAAVAALASVPFVPAGTPVLVAAVVAVAAALAPQREPVPA